MDLTTTSEARIQMVFNSNIGVAINGQGTSNLRFIYDKQGDFYIYGDYQIEKGGVYVCSAKYNPAEI